MRQKRTSYAGTDDRRRQIVEAALACFIEIGFNDTTMQDIRSRSKASNGSIYHHFKSKEQLAAAVYLEGIRAYQASMLDTLAQSKTAREGIFNMIECHLVWSRDHQAWARFLSDRRHAEFMSDSETAIAEANSFFGRTIWAFFSRHIEAGTLERLPPEFYISVILAPCHEYSRQRLRRFSKADWTALASQFGEAAWRALRSKKKRSPPGGSTG
jgi:AcrR family transcriptional regulator